MIFRKIYEKPIYLQILFSAFIGVFLACIFVFPFTTAAFQLFENKNDYWLRDLNILKGMLGGPLYFPFAIIITIPLIVIAMLMGQLFRKSIDNNLLLWCICAPISVWIFETIFISLTRDNHYYQSHTFIENFVTTITSPDNFLYLFGPMPAAIIFFLIRSKNLKVQ